MNLIHASWSLKDASDESIEHLVIYEQTYNGTSSFSCTVDVNVTSTRDSEDCLKAMSSNPLLHCTSYQVTVQTGLNLTSTSTTTESRYTLFGKDNFMTPIF